MKKISLLLCSVALILLNSACTHRLTDFTVISTKNVPIGSTSTAIKKADKRVKGEDKAHVVLCIPLGSPNMKEAIDKAIEQYPDAIGLVDGVVKSHSWTCLFYGQNSYVVEGTPIYQDAVEEIIDKVQQAPNYPNNTPQQYNATQNQEQMNSENFAVLFYHDVKKGDTLASIAEAYKVSISDIIKWNQLNSSNLTPGTKLRIMMK